MQQANPRMYLNQNLLLVSVENLGSKRWQESDDKHQESIKAFLKALVCATMETSGDKVESQMRKVVCRGKLAWTSRVVMF